MLSFVFEHVVAFWRLYLLPIMVILLSTVMIFIGLAGQEYIETVAISFCT
ncbi:putative ABC transport system permease protein [Arcanobacterium phocae]|uniref:Putative ABC transport system permease protein n=1 Tax=Arcanobacterium phocae TaxID=131112 RepID=A0A1H2LP66_9ACTO|nr:putative ABC transport system permease protein [Arcanobacterium phocae]